MAFLLHILSLIGLGLVTGILSGMLGIGGGIVIVPSLLVIFHGMGLDPSRLMQFAVGTSLGVMVINATSATTFHIIKERPNYKLLLKILPFVCIGVLGGTILAHFLSTAWLKRIFSILLLFIAYKLIRGKKRIDETQANNDLTFASGGVLGVAVGFCSGLLGIGGGVITVPFLLHKAFKYRQAIIISLLISVTSAVTGVILYMIVGSTHHIPTPHGFIGDVYVYGALLVALGAIPGTYLASRLLPYCSIIWLKRIFAILLLITAVHLLLP